MQDRYRSGFFLAALAFMGIVLMSSAGCATVNPDETTVPLPGSQWTLKKINQQAIPARYAPTLHFGEGNALSGSAGCNRYNARFEHDAQSFEVGKISSTRKLCSAERMQVEKQYLSLLKDVISLKNFCNELTLTSGEGDRLVFDRNPSDI